MFLNHLSSFFFKCLKNFCKIRKFKDLLLTDAKIQLQRPRLLCPHVGNPLENVILIRMLCDHTQQYVCDDDDRTMGR